MLVRLGKGGTVFKHWFMVFAAIVMLMIGVYHVNWPPGEAAPQQVVMDLDSGAILAIDVNTRGTPSPPMFANTINTFQSQVFGVGNANQIIGNPRAAGGTLNLTDEASGIAKGNNYTGSRNHRMFATRIGAHRARDADQKAYKAS